MTRALVLVAFLSSPAAAGGLAPAASPLPPERPARPANLCQHIPWTMCLTGEPDGGSALPDAREATVVEKPQGPEKPDTGCKSNRKLGC